jgi:pimeloyl-ACP methyl ester carboxylesterase
MFLTGFMSDMTGSKALALESWCRAEGRAFVRFDYQGHGASSGAFRDGSIGLWAEDALAVLDQVAKGPQILVGSSMGGWIMLLAALARPERVKGLAGIAAAPDFTQSLIWRDMTPEQRADMERQGFFEVPSQYGEQPYVITRHLIEDGRKRLLLGQTIAIQAPVRLIHGLDDPDVPWQTALDLQDKLASKDVEVTLVKGGGHRLSEPQDLDRLVATVARLAAQLAPS